MLALEGPVARGPVACVDAIRLRDRIPESHAELCCLSVIHLSQGSARK